MIETKTGPASERATEQFDPQTQEEDPCFESLPYEPILATPKLNLELEHIQQPGRSDHCCVARQRILDLIDLGEMPDEVAIEILHALSTIRDEILFSRHPDDVRYVDRKLYEATYVDPLDVPDHSHTSTPPDVHSETEHLESSEMVQSVEPECDQADDSYTGWTHHHAAPLKVLKSLLGHKDRNDVPEWENFRFAFRCADALVEFAAEHHLVERERHERQTAVHEVERIIRSDGDPDNSTTTIVNALADPFGISAGEAIAWAQRAQAQQRMAEEEVRMKEKRDRRKE